MREVKGKEGGVGGGRLLNAFVTFVIEFLEVGALGKLDVVMVISSHGYAVFDCFLAICRVLLKS